MKLVKRGEIRWYSFRIADKRRPVLILTRNDVMDRLNQIIVVPATRTIRGLTTEVVLTVDEGMPAACALNFDRVAGATESNWSRALRSIRDAMGRSAGCATHRVRFRKIKRLRLRNRHGQGMIDLSCHGLAHLGYLG